MQDNLIQENEAMSVMICVKCEGHIDTDLEEGQECNECGNFACGSCIDDNGFCCPVCDELADDDTLTPTQ